MKLRYYMRGLGIGVIVTAILMGIALGGDKEKLTDAEIMARAKELGMVESSYLADLGKEKESQLPGQEGPIEDLKEEVNESSKENETEDSKEDSDVIIPPEDKKEEVDTENPPVDNKEETTTDKSNEDKKEETDTDDQTGENEKEDSQTEEEDEQYVTLIIEKGESSVSVSKNLEELGLVDSAKAYDRYLCENGYDKLIRVGTHKIKVGSTDEEIAKVISRKKK